MDTENTQGTTDVNENTEGINAGDQSQQEDTSGEKTFTQAQLSAVAATEKKQGKQSILNIFGVKDEKTAKEQAKAFKEWQDSQKTAEAKVKEQEEQISEANAKAAIAESKLSCVMAGVNKDSVDDVLAIAVTKVTDDKDLDDVLEEMKKEPRYKGFFGTESGSSKGTGTPDGHQGTGNAGGKTDNLGERLGKARQTSAKKSNFFTN